MYIEELATKIKKALCERVCKDFYGGGCPYIVVSMIDTCFDEYGFDPAVIYALFAHAYICGCKKDYEMLKVFAKVWYNNHLTTTQSFEKYVRFLFPGIEVDGI